MYMHYAYGPQKFRLGINCDPGRFYIREHFAQKNAAQDHILAATGKEGYCLLNVMVQFGSFSPDEIWQVGDLTQFYIGSKGFFFTMVPP